MAAANVTEENFKLEPMNITWGLAEVSTVTCVADVASSLNDTYFELSSAGNATDYYVWIDVNSAGTDPAIAGKTGIEVDIAVGATASEVATAVAAAIDAVGDFGAAAVSSVVTITNAALGNADDIADGASATGFTFAVTTQGSGGNLGGSVGGITVTKSVEMVDVIADQTGGMIQDQIITAVNVEVSMTLPEMTQDRWESLVGRSVGGIHTPAGGTRIIGYGEGSLFRNMSSVAGFLTLNPVGSSDQSRDLNFPAAYPVPSSINFSGSDISGMEVTFRAIRKSENNDDTNLFFFGDGTQTLT